MAAKARLAAMAANTDLDPKLAAFIADVVAEAQKEGRIIFRGMGISYCRLCGKSAGYAKFRSGWKKGQDNHKKPLHLSGREFADRFVIIRGHAALGGCAECIDKLLPPLRVALADVRAEIPESITGHSPRFRRYRNRKCTKCEWVGHEGQMRRERTLMGDGTYPAGCPKCSAANAPLGPREVDTVDGYTIAESGE